MRDDMSHVLVDSPRFGRLQARACAGARRLQRQRLDPGGETAVQRLGMRRDALARKDFGEHLSPLYRWLQQQVHRPWAQVFSELCAQLDRRSVVQAHLFQHIGDRVVTATVWRNGEVWARGWTGLAPIAEHSEPLFVHPRTGILLPNRARVIAERQKREARALRAAQPHPDRRSGLPGMSPADQWHRIDGIWYALKLGSLPPAGSAAAAFDVVLKRVVDGRDAALLKSRYGQAGLYARTKRQLGQALLRANGLRSDGL